jgi:hypothetical protein
MLDFQLFRIKVIYPSQRDFFWEDPDRAGLLSEAIHDNPEADLRKGITWHIGNVEDLGPDGIYLRLGRTTKTTMEVFEKGKFLDQAFETAPYTHVLVDLEYGICAIARKTRLSPNAAGIARQLARLLAKTERISRLKIEIKLDDIKDPEDFIHHLRSAYAIQKFTVWFSRPNPWDVNDFQGALQRYADASNAEQGKAEIKGESLDTEVAEELSHAVAATGDDASAQLMPEGGRKPITKRLRGNPVTLKEDEIGDRKEKATILGRIRSLYLRVRNPEERG